MTSDNLTDATVMSWEKVIAHFVLHNLVRLEEGQWSSMSVRSQDTCNTYLQPMRILSLLLWGISERTGVANLDGNFNIVISTSGESIFKKSSQIL